MRWAMLPLVENAVGREFPKMNNENKRNEVWRRRIALQLASQLPEDRDEAVAVVRLMMGLVRFVAVDEIEDQDDRVVSFPLGISSSSRAT